MKTILNFLKVPGWLNKISLDTNKKITKSEKEISVFNE